MPRAGTTWIACALLGVVTCRDPPLAAGLSEHDFLTDFPTAVSASRLRQNIADTPQAVTIIDQETIRAAGVREIAELFRLVPGFNVTYATHVKGVQPIVTYHGLGREYFSRLQVLIDGRSVNNATLGGVDWSDFPLALDDIERVEVVRGPSAATHGIGAFLGTINFVSKHPLQQRGLFASVNAGTDAIFDAVARYGGVVSGTDFRFTTQHQSDDGFPDAHYHKALDLATLRADWQIDALQSLMLQAGVTSRSTDTGSDLAFDPRRKARFETGYAQLRWERSLDADDAVAAQVYHYTFKLSDRFATQPIADLGGLVFDIDSGSRVSRTDIELQHNFRIGPTARFVWGGSLREDQAEAPLILAQPERLRIARLFGHVEWNAGARVLLNAGAMLEHNSQSGTNVAPQASLHFRITPEQTVRVGVSRSLRDPTLFEDSLQSIVIGPDGVPILVAGNVRPETIVSTELGYVGQFPAAGATLELKLFRDRLHDLIALVGGTTTIPPTAFPKAVVNGDDARQTGVEGQFLWRPLAATSLAISGAHLTTASDDRFASYSTSAPRNTFHVLASQRVLESWDGSIAYHQQSGYLPLGALAAQPGFRRVDLRIAKRLPLGAGSGEVSVVVENAFAARYTDLTGTNIGQRRAWLSFSVKL
jgi:iron complex outermembrane receptor protein